MTRHVRPALYVFALLVLVLVLSTLGCAEDQDAGDTDSNCHIDCGGGYVCEDGVVSKYPYGPMPCSEGDTCPLFDVGQCAGGCTQSSWSGGAFGDAGEAEWRANLCAETTDAGDLGG